MTAYVQYVGSLGKRRPVLTISDGCWPQVVTSPSPSPTSSPSPVLEILAGRVIAPPTPGTSQVMGGGRLALTGWPWFLAAFLGGVAMVAGGAALVAAASRWG